MFGNKTGLPHSTISDETTQDALEHQLLCDQATITVARARQLAAIVELDRRQVALADGYQTMSEWVAARLDESPENAAALVRTARTLTTEIAVAMSDGEISFARAVEVARLATAGVEDALNKSWAHDIAGLRRRGAAHRRIAPADEQDVADARYLVIQPTLDELSWRLWGQLPGVEGRIVEKALSERIDEFPHESASVSQRRADALVAVCQDSLTGSTAESSPMSVAVFVDATQAAATNAETGLVVEAGPRIGRRTLEGILCNAITEVTARTEAGTLVDIGPRERTLPTRIRNHVLNRDDGRCTIDSCTSRYRIEVHHIDGWAKTKDHNPDRLMTTCWWHHQIAIHRMGLVVDETSPPHRRRLVKPECENRSPP